MAAINAVGNSLTGLTGTGAFVGATSPILVTPTLGVASATSINFGGGALGSYTTKASWTPVLTFVTPGDLALSGESVQAFYYRIGDMVYYTCVYAVTPTFTTSSGDARITGLPVVPLAGSGTVQFLLGNSSSSLAYPGATTTLIGQCAGTLNYITLTAQGTSTNNNVTAANFTSGNAQSFRFEFFCFVA